MTRIDVAPGANLVDLANEITAEDGRRRAESEGVGA